MNEIEWASSTDLHRLLRFASEELKMIREVRLFSIACIERLPFVYSLEVAILIELAKQHFDEGKWSLRNLQKAAEHPEVCRYDAPFYLAWSDPLQAALRVVDGILIDTDWTEHDCLPVFREVFGNPFQSTSLQVTESMRTLAMRVYTTGSELLELAKELVAYPEMSAHLLEEKWHPRGCWVLDNVLGRRRNARQSEGT